MWDNSCDLALCLRFGWGPCATEMPIIIVTILSLLSHTLTQDTLGSEHVRHVIEMPIIIIMILSSLLHTLTQDTPGSEHLRQQLLSCHVPSYKLSFVLNRWDNSFDFIIVTYLDTNYTWLWTCETCHRNAHYYYYDFVITVTYFDTRHTWLWTREATALVLSRTFIQVVLCSEQVRQWLWFCHHCHIPWHKPHLALNMWDNGSDPVIAVTYLVTSCTWLWTCETMARILSSLSHTQDSSKSRRLLTPPFSGLVTLATFCFWLVDAIALWKLTPGVRSLAASWSCDRSRDWEASRTMKSTTARSWSVVNSKTSSDVSFCGRNTKPVGYFNKQWLYQQDNHNCDIHLNRYCGV